MADGWNNPIVGGGNSLIREEIKSPNFVSGTAGWDIAKDGAAEFNELDARGSIEAGNGTVRLNAGGIHVEGIGKQFDVNISAGFLARRSTDDGSTIQVAIPASPSTHSGNLTMRPTSPTANANNLSAAFVDAEIETVGTRDTPWLNIYSPSVGAKSRVLVRLYGEDSDSAFPARLYVNKRVDLLDELNVTGDLNVNGESNFTGTAFFTGAVADPTGITYLKGQAGVTTMTFASTVSATQNITFPIPFATAPSVNTNINSGAGPTARWSSRAINITTTGFTMFVFSGNAVAAAWTGIDVGWSAYV